jgi:uncharacterized protein
MTMDMMATITIGGFPLTAQKSRSSANFDNPLFIAARPEDVVLVEAPIQRDWIVSGAPRARAGLHSPSVDGRAATNIWDCTSGSFWWTFYNEETVLILEGAVQVTTEDGETRTLLPGDIAYFAEGSKALWQIDRYVKKVAFCRHRASGPVTRLRAVLARMRSPALGSLTSLKVLTAIGIALPL